MKSIALFVLLFTAATARADAWWHDGGRYHEPYDHKVHHKSYKHKSRKRDSRDHNSKHYSEKHYSKKHHSNKHYSKKDKSYKDRGHYRDSHHAKSDRRNHHAYDHRRGYRDGYRDGRHHGEYKTSRRWEPVQGFRGRSGRDVTRYIGVNDHVRALSIEGTKRGMYIRKAYALLGNGRWVRVHGLEGYVSRGERISHRLRYSRYVKQIVLDVEPAHYKRGYAQLLVRRAH